MRAPAMIGIGLGLSAGPAWAQSNPTLVDPSSSAPQIVPTYWERGTWATPSTVAGAGGPAFTGTAPVTTTQPGATTTGTFAGGTDPMSNMLATAYGQTAVTAAEQIGVNPAAVAGVGQAESNFRNIPAANGTTSATGPWQFTSGTFQQVSQQYDLGYTAADITNPNAQATEAAYYLRDAALAVSNGTGQPATTIQAYGGYMFGPAYAARIATASASTPLSTVVPASFLANNGMSSWTVGQFQQTVAGRLGPAANQPVLTNS
jgi:Transglycosylase SLT domain